MFLFPKMLVALIFSEEAEEVVSYRNSHFAGKQGNVCFLFKQALRPLKNMSKRIPFDLKMPIC